MLAMLLAGTDLWRHKPYMMLVLPCTRLLLCTYDKDMEVEVFMQVLPFAQVLHEGMGQLIIRMGNSSAAI